MPLRGVYLGVLLAASLGAAQPGFPGPTPTPAPGDNYSKAVSLFNAKDYQAALPLFQQALREDPKNAQAYYYLGSCQEVAGDPRGEALNYYISNKLSPDAGMKSYADKVNEKLSPEDQDWVEKQFDAFSQSAPQTTAQPSPSTTAGDYSQGVSLYNAKDYPAALPLFQQVVQDDTRNALAYYYLGSCQKKAGYLRGEALNFYLSDRLHPYPALKAVADKVMAQLSPVDQAWVKQRLDASANPLAAGQTVSPAPPNHSPFGVRFSGGLAFFNLADFQQDLSFRQYLAAGLQASYPNDGISIQTSLPGVNPTFELNPYLKANPNIEMGLAFVYWPSATVQYNITVAQFPQYHIHGEWDINTVEFLLTSRFYAPSSNPKDVRVYAEPFAGLQPIGLHFGYNYAGTSSTPSSDQVSADYSDMALAAGLKMGLTFYTGPNSFFSMTGSYQVASASNFQGNLSDTDFPNSNGHGSLHMFKYATTGQNYIIYIPDNPSQLPAFNENSSTLTSSTPFTVDLGGFHFDLDFSVVF